MSGTEMYECSCRVRSASRWAGPRAPCFSIASVIPEMTTGCLVRKTWEGVPGASASSGKRSRRVRANSSLAGSTCPVAGLRRRGAEPLQAPLFLGDVDGAPVRDVGHGQLRDGLQGGPVVRGAGE